MIINIYIFIFFVTFLFFLFLNKLQNFINIFDIPDKIKKLHKKKVPPIGGFIFVIIIIKIFLLSFFYDLDLIIFQNDREYFTFYCISILLFFIGFLDDKYNLTYKTRVFLLFLIFMSSILIDQNLIIKNLYFMNHNKYVELNSFSVMFTTLCLLTFINAFNMFDGINCQSILYFMSVLLFLILKNIYISLCLALLIPSLFFFIYNCREKIFLGNSGSLMLPYIISYLLIKEYNINFSIKVEEIIVLMIIPFLDLLRLFFTRIINQKNPFVSDRNHIHHILSKKFNSNIKAVIIIFSLTFIPITMVAVNLKLLNLVILLQLLSYIYFIKIKKA